jgi:hypothetical protein
MLWVGAILKRAPPGGSTCEEVLPLDLLRAAEGDAHGAQCRVAEHPHLACAAAIIHMTSTSQYHSGRVEARMSRI